MSAAELRQAAATMRGFEPGDAICIHEDVAHALADLLEERAEFFELAEDMFFAVNEDGAVKAARLINGGVA